MRPLRVVVLTPPVEADAPPDRADTFVQAAEIAECLAELGHCATALAFDPNRVSTAEQLTAFAPDLVVNLVEDVPEGADQAHIVTTMLDSLGLRYTGAPTAALAALGSKPAMKRQLAAAGLPVAGDLGAPDATYIVKSAIEHASIGLDESSVVEGAATATASAYETGPPPTWARLATGAGRVSAKPKRARSRSPLPGQSRPTTKAMARPRMTKRAMNRSVPAACFMSEEGSRRSWRVWWRLDFAVMAFIVRGGA